MYKSSPHHQVRLLPHSGLFHPLTTPPSEKCQAQFDLSIALSLAFWPALSLAVTNNWGGASSSEKRDWFAGAISDLFINDPATDIVDVETVLLQVMLDEFEVNVDDESAYDVADNIMRFRKQCEEGKFQEVEELRARWLEREKKGGDRGVEATGFRRVERGEEEDETDWDSESEEEDEEMGDAPPPKPKEKVEPEVDEDGFTTVVSKKKR